MKVLGLVIMIAFIMSGCEEKYNYNDCHEAKVLSYKELRADYPRVKEGRDIVKAAKIYNYKNGDILLINERNKGIHIVDNRLKHKVTKGNQFIEIPGNVDMAVKDGYLYADSFTDLVVLDIRDINDIKVVSRKERIFPEDFNQAVRNDMTKNKCSHYGNDGFVIGYK